MLINSIKNMHQILKKEVVCFLSYLVGWKIQRIGWFWRPSVSNCILYWGISLNMGSACNQDKSAKATSFCELLTSFDFLFSLFITRSVLDVALLVTELLQGLSIDIADATRLIESMKSLVVVNTILLIPFIKCYSDILELACKVGIEESKPRISNLQRTRSNWIRINF